MSAPACFLDCIMSDRLIDITPENIDSEHLCCIIRTKKPHPGVEKKRAWLSDQSFAKKFGFETVDETENGYELLALSFDGTKPRFAENAKKETIDSKKLTVYYDAQCPFIPGRIESNRKFCEENGIDADFIEVDSLEKAKNLPCVFNNWAVFCGEKFVTVNLLDERALKKLSDGGK